jgi:hypothetical protein
MDNGGCHEIARSKCEAVPDAFVHGLYHYYLAQCDTDLELLFGRSRRGGLTDFIAPFQFVAIDSWPPDQGPACTALASKCSGTVLVVHAGESSRSVIREIALNVTHAGGRVIGVVLDQAPLKLPTWIRQS